MIHKIQRQWCIWPEGSLQGTEPEGRVSRWDKVVGLIPQSRCLFKIFYYNIELIPQKDLEQCVENEISQLTSWNNPHCFFLVNKVDENWQVITWVWDDDQIQFGCPVTHKLPALAYFLGRTRASQGILYYSEAVNDSSAQAWAITWKNVSVVEHLYPMNSPIHARVIKQLLDDEQESMSLYSNLEDVSLLDGYPVKPLHHHVKSKVMTKAKCSAQLEFDNPWIYWRTMLWALCLFCVYLVADASLLKYEQSHFSELVSQKQQTTLSIQNQRSRYEDNKRFVEQAMLAKEKQQFIAILLEELTTKLAKDVMITKLTYDQKSILLEGTVQNSTGVLESLSNISFVKEARLLGEVVPTGNERQKFRAEVSLRELK
ncbi:hypothetical protein [Vibrio quintilis]|uniref:Fimbrial assembly protein (PilN) n=1 Tax=Vibrio quintilis TaxID=1117707 RepID=A0A1M7YY58_9VIBR|nr:hypothetical protein [Vibrio quintilis]SHO57580.1 hypothetical protein VQ7734_03350 [Vibrio quintilis]